MIVLELQKDFNQYGKKFFKFESLEIDDKYVSQQLRKEKENEYISKINYIYNSLTK